MAMTTGRKTVGETALEVDLGFKPKVGVTITAAGANAGAVYVGASDAITEDADDDTDGYPIQPGEEFFIPLAHFSGGTSFWLIASTAGEKVWWSAV